MQWRAKERPTRRSTLGKHFAADQAKAKPSQKPAPKPQKSPAKAQTKSLPLTLNQRR